MVGLRTCFYVSVPREEFQGALETPKAALAAPQYPLDQAVIELLQAILDEGNHRSYDPDYADNQRAECNRA